jgi:hypothetical protein
MSPKLLWFLFFLLSFFEEEVGSRGPNRALASVIAGREYREFTHFHPDKWVSMIASSYVILDAQYTNHLKAQHLRFSRRGL